MVLTPRKTSSHTYCGDFQGKWQWEVGMPQCRGTPNRVLFLSVDGVLHPAETRKDSHFDRTNMAHWNTIIEMTGSALVFSSSWRLKSSWCMDVYETLKDHGIAPFFSRTPRVWHKKEHWWHDDRGLEIKAWVVHHNQGMGYGGRSGSDGPRRTCVSYRPVFWVNGIISATHCGPVR